MFSTYSTLKSFNSILNDIMQLTSFFRDSHVLHFSCDGLAARFDFTPIHPYALHVRSSMSFPTQFHNANSLKLLQDLPVQFSSLFEGFRRSISLIQLTAEEVRACVLMPRNDIMLSILYCNSYFHCFYFIDLDYLLFFII